MSEANKAVMRRIYDAFNQGNLQEIDAIVEANITDHNPGPGVPPTREGFKQFITAMRTAFPDLRIVAEQMVAEGDLVATRFVATGTQRGEMMGMPATGKQVTMTGMDLVRFSNGKAVEHWGNQDDLGMMQQLGIVPPPPGR